MFFFFWLLCIVVCVVQCKLQGTGVRAPPSPPLFCCSCTVPHRVLLFGWLYIVWCVCVCVESMY